MSVRLDVWSDFMCPYCFAASLSIRALMEQRAVAVHWRAYELRPAGSPPIPPWYLERIEQARPRFAAMMWESHGLTIHSGTFGISSRRALIGAKYAESLDAATAHAYHDAAFRAYWLDAQDVSDTGVLMQIAASVGMDAGAFAAALDDPHFDQAVTDDIAQAEIYGLTGVPALVFNGKYLLSGAQPVEMLARVVERLESGQGLGVGGIAGGTA